MKYWIRYRARPWAPWSAWHSCDKRLYILGQAEMYLYRENTTTEVKEDPVENTEGVGCADIL